MYRLLLVDNERHVVDGLYELFTQECQLDLEAYRAYNGEEALNWLERTKIDIVVSDIRMPEMSGLELQKEIAERWPRCRVVFLTGYSEFDYIQDAMRNGACQYLLKTEGDEALLEAVERIIADIEAELRQDILVEQAKRRLKLALPTLQRQHLLDLLQESASSAQDLEQFKALEIPLDCNMDVLIAIGRVDDWNGYRSNYDRAPLLFAIQNIVEEYFAESVNLVTVPYERTRLIWLMQPKPLPDGAKPSAGEWNRAIRFVHGMMESVQRTCKSLLKLPLSVTVAGKAAEWRRAGEKFDRLKLLSSHGLGMGQELLLIEPEREETHRGDADNWTYRSRLQIRRIELLAEYLENGQRYQFFQEFPQIVTIVSSLPAAAESLTLELKYAFGLLFVRFLNKWSLWDELGKTVDVGRLASLGNAAPWPDTAEYYAEVAERIFQYKSAGRQQQENDVVQQIHHYVQMNIAGDVSLTRIGEVVGHSSAYVSRLYKNITQTNLSDYIHEIRIGKAKEMLGQSRFKIQEIAKLLGFENDRYFYRYFKKATGLTPQEFRESQERRHGYDRQEK